MFKLFVTLLRGQKYEAEQAVIDRHSLPLLRQQIRDCAWSVQASRRAVAVAMAQNDQEKAQHKRVLTQIADLETRTLAALDQGHDDLARDAADAIAHLEAERDTSGLAQTRFATEITRLRQVLRDAETRLRQLQRGQRIAVATDQTQRLRDAAPDSGLSTLREAEETLVRLQQRQTQLDATAVAMTELDHDGNPEALRDRLAEAGCGAQLKSNADSVLERLRARKTEETPA